MFGACRNKATPVENKCSDAEWCLKTREAKWWKIHLNGTNIGILKFLSLNLFSEQLA